MDPLIHAIAKHEGTATIVTLGPDGPHVVATWNSYLDPCDDETLLIPVGNYQQTERNINSGSDLTMLIGSREVAGKRGPGTGVRLRGRAEFEYQGARFERVKSRFPWARACLTFRVGSCEQLL
ncbi:MAG: pyridoxamine 5'-phosphate oxidase family protein [Gammaproteobacteria bacterium]|nr:pyridoxamine 5'-phosphate oxidase family protein [Gammaproteobacteria bacterium]